MKKLIKIQSLINEIEQLSLLQVQYKTRFDYINETTMIAKCFCVTYAISLFQVLKEVDGVIVNINNSKLEFIDKLETVDYRS